MRTSRLNEKSSILRGTKSTDDGGTHVVGGELQEILSTDDGERPAITEGVLTRTA